MRGGSAEPVGLGITIEQRDGACGNAVVFSIEVSPTELRLNTPDPWTDLVIEARLGAAEEAGTGVIVFIVDVLPYPVLGAAAGLFAQGPAGTGVRADIKTGPTERWRGWCWHGWRGLIRQICRNGRTNRDQACKRDSNDQRFAHESALT